HRARLARGIESAAYERGTAVIGKATAYRHHFPMRRRIAVCLAEVAPARDHLAVAHDDRAERIVAAPRLVERKPHEALVVGRSACGGRRPACRYHGRGGEADDHAAAVRKQG